VKSGYTIFGCAGDTVHQGWRQHMRLRVPHTRWSAGAARYTHGYAALQHAAGHARYEQQARSPWLPLQQVSTETHFAIVSGLQRGHVLEAVVGRTVGIVGARLDGRAYGRKRRGERSELRREHSGAPRRMRLWLLRAGCRHARRLRRGATRAPGRAGVHAAAQRLRVHGARVEGGSVARVCGRANARADSSQQPPQLSPYRGMRRAWPARVVVSLLCLLLIPFLASASGATAAVRAHACFVLLSLPLPARLADAAHAYVTTPDVCAGRGRSTSPARCARAARSVCGATLPIEDARRAGACGKAPHCGAALLHACLLCSLRARERHERVRAVLSGHVRSIVAERKRGVSHPCMHAHSPGSARGAQRGPRGAAAQRRRAPQRRFGAEPVAAAVAAGGCENTAQCVPRVTHTHACKLHARVPAACALSLTRSSPALCAAAKEQSLAEVQARLRGGLGADPRAARVRVHGSARRAGGGF
jgi:hypothetical protein